MNTRVAVVRILQQVLSGHSLTASFQQQLNTLEAKRQPFVKALCFGVLRQYHQLCFVRDALLSKPLKNKDLDVSLLLLCGLCELTQKHTAPYAVVSESVHAVKTLKKKWAAGLVNALLRNYLRRGPSISEGQQDAQATWSHPTWMIQAVQRDWPQHWRDILRENNRQAPLVLRVNPRQISRVAYLQQLAQAGFPAHAHVGTHCGVQVETPVDVTQLPGFTAGLVSVQDGAAQQPVQMLSLAPGLRVLDACAAPGGKTCQILESEAQLTRLVAMDKDADRLLRLSENLHRLHLSAEVQVGDFTHLDWWDGVGFDRVLLDAPCSGSGVIRRHPDIKLLRLEHDVVALSQQQHKMLDVAWSILKAGGRLVYATCSIFKAESELQIERFLEEHPAAQLTAEVRILPGEDGNDGFYYACLEKE